MAAALPVVACDVPGLNEVVADGKQYHKPTCLQQAGSGLWFFSGGA